MRLAALLLVGLGLWACAGPPNASPSLVGTWRSDRALTLVELGKASGLDPALRRRFSGPYWFGDLVLEIDEATITTRLPYHRGVDAYRILERGDDFVVLESRDAAGHTQVLRCIFRGEQLLVPIAEHGFHEVFVRVTAPE